MTPRQLALPFAHAPHYDPRAFLAAPSNAAARAWLARPQDWPHGRLALWGEAGSGKTHLLHAWAERVLPASLLRGVPPLPEAGRIGLDDADAPGEEAALLHLLNASAEGGRKLLLAGRSPPARWPVRLPDLASRLRATAAVRIDMPEDALLRALLSRLLAERQLAVAPALQDWLRLRLPRTAGAMREAAARLDRAALASGGRVTRALAGRILEGLADSEEDMTPDEGFVSEADLPPQDHPAFL